MIKVKVSSKENKVFTIRLNARRTVDGNIMVYDHPQMDIAILTGNCKVVALPKVEINDEVYGCINRFFDFLRKEGAIIHDSVQGGNVFYSIEAKFPEESQYGDPMQFILYSIYTFLKDEMPELEFVDHVRDIHKKDLVDPNVDDSTEYGEVPPSDEKGALLQRSMPYGGPYRTFQEGLDSEDQKLLNEILSRDFSKGK